MANRQPPALQTAQLLLTLANSHAKTIEVYDKLLPLLENRISELNSVIRNLQHEVNSLNSKLEEIQNLSEESEESDEEQSDNIAITELM